MCSKCSQPREGKDRYCKKCRREYNVRKALPSVRERQWLLRQIADAFKDVPCADCGIHYPPYVMDFDHLGNKKNNVSRLTQFSNIDNLVAEILKCEVVCSNCHRERTHARVIKSVVD